MHNKYAVTQLFWTMYCHFAINDQQVLTWWINFICFTAIHTGDCCIHLRVFRTLHGTSPHTKKENEMKSRRKENTTPFGVNLVSSQVL